MFTCAILLQRLLDDVKIYYYSIIIIIIIIIVIVIVIAVALVGKLVVVFWLNESLDVDSIESSSIVDYGVCPCIFFVTLHVLLLLQVFR